MSGAPDFFETRGIVCVVGFVVLEASGVSN
jgi:hypothetical protein